MSNIKKTLLTFFLINAFFFASSAIAADKNPGTIIPDTEAYPFYQHSQLSESSLQKGQANIILETSPATSISRLTSLFENWRLPFEITSETPFIIETDWLLWHYDENTGKSLSEPQNNFFSLNTRDRYRFKFNIETGKEQAILKLSQSWREQEEDITPDSAMVWLKWKKAPVDKRAMKAFLLRLQTEFEKLALAEDKNLQLIVPQIGSTKDESLANYRTINQPVATVWSQLILTLGNENIPIESADNQRHIIKTNWFQPAYDKHADYHRFKITLTAGATPAESSIFVHHIATKGKNQGQKNLDNSKDKLAMEATFLNKLQLNR